MVFLSELLVCLFFVSCTGYFLRERSTSEEGGLPQDGNICWKQKIFQYLNCHCKWTDFCWLRETDTFQTAMPAVSMPAVIAVQRSHV